ncbi:carboxypeptidase N subunit 2 [Caerostris extrusa]|uniref:Carboxypeptidase N subunit 2 n=1 Tax=Caerostris extrusa TaxID=172846 RepID=A0AAV4NZR7_CAEEX|nr:carboxypeptidase N subunit 2 [Caerostris extrusa]
MLNNCSTDIGSMSASIPASKIFQHLAKLEKLDLSFNRLTSLPTEIFHSFAQSEGNQSPGKSRYLKYLDLRDNQLEALTKQCFSKSLFIHTLFLSKNSIRRIDKDAFTSLTELKNLTLDSNMIRFLNGSIRNLGNKWICDCRMSWILNLKTGKDLASHFRCTKPVMFHGKKLDQLIEMDQNILSEDCSPLCQCTCVTKDNDYYVRVDCSRKGLTQIPAVLPEEIGELLLQDNRLSSLSDLNKHSLERLRYLNVEWNLLDKLDCTLPKNLETLMLAHNRFQRFPTNFPTNVSSWTLSKNYWLCDCNAITFLKFLENRKVQGK